MIKIKFEGSVDEFLQFAEILRAGREAVARAAEGVTIPEHINLEPARAYLRGGSRSGCIDAIKDVRSRMVISLVEAKRLVESLPEFQVWRNHTQPDLCEEES